MIPGRYDFTILQGSTFALTLAWTNEDDTALSLTGFEARLTAREKKSDTSALFEWTSNPAAGITITVPATLGIMEISILPTTTDDYNFDIGVYDLEIYNVTDVYRLLEGYVTLNKESTT